MSQTREKPAVLSDQEIKKVRELERALGDGVVVVAYEKPLVPAKLAAAKLKQLQQVERELGDVYLVAWNKPAAVGG